SGFALEERHAESFAGRAIDEPVPALEPLEPLRRGSDRLFDQLGPGFELAWRSLVLRDTSEHRVPPPFRSITEASLRAGPTRQPHAPAQTTPSSSRERCKSAGSRYTRNAPAEVSSSHP